MKDQDTKESATITMTASVLGRIRAVAKTEKRSLSQQLEMLVENHFKEKPLSVTRRRASKPSTKREAVPA